MGVDPKPVSAAAFWEGLYAQGEDGWELREPAPPLVAWLAGGGRFSISGGPEMAPALPHLENIARGTADIPHVAVPGCGRGHDVRLLARQGYRAVGFDFAAPAVDEALALAAAEGVDAAFEMRDIFGLPAHYREAFDAVWEYTCFCAIDPARRAEYVEVLRSILKPGGTLLGCFYPLRDGNDGPPFPVARAEIEALLAPGFRIVGSAPPARSVERRRGLEWLIRAVRD